MKFTNEMPKAKNVFNRDHNDFRDCAKYENCSVANIEEVRERENREYRDRNRRIRDYVGACLDKQDYKEIGVLSGVLSAQQEHLVKHSIAKDIEEFKQLNNELQKMVQCAGEALSKIHDKINYFGDCFQNYENTRKLSTPIE